MSTETDLEPATDPAREREREVERVAHVLRRVRSAVRQRQAVEATIVTGSPRAVGRSDELRRHEAIREPHPFSHRPGLGRFIVAVRRGVYLLFLKWAVRPILEQQNAFNAAVSRTMQEILAENDRLRERLRAAEARLEGLQGDGERSSDGEPEPSPSSRPPQARREDR